MIHSSQLVLASTTGGHVDYETAISTPGVYKLINGSSCPVVVVKEGEPPLYVMFGSVRPFSEAVQNPGERTYWKTDEPVPDRIIP